MSIIAYVTFYSRRNKYFEHIECMSKPLHKMSQRNEKNICAHGQIAKAVLKVTQTNFSSP
jgi:hypothetical protein